MEALRYSNSVSKYTVHCAFPSNINTDAFFQEQKNKPQLTKAMEGTAGDAAALEKKLPSAKKVADYIVSHWDTSDFAICDSTDSSILFANMIGPSPKRGLGIVDSLLAVVVQLMIWPLQRRQWDAMCKKDGK
jgi:3-dehydrosphinganine reductase